MRKTAEVLRTSGRLSMKIGLGAEAIGKLKRLHEQIFEDLMDDDDLETAKAKTPKHSRAKGSKQAFSFGELQADAGEDEKKPRKAEPEQPAFRKNESSIKKKLLRAAEAARKTAIIAAFLAAATLAIGCAAACAGAALGARHRDERTAVSFLGATRFW